MLSPLSTSKYGKNLPLKKIKEETIHSDMEIESNDSVYFERKRAYTISTVDSQVTPALSLNKTLSH